MNRHLGATSPLLRVLRTLLALGAACVAAAFAGEVAAAERYACDCGPGADAQCVAGDDAADGATVATPWRSYARARQAWTTLAPGDAIRFCRGGVLPVSDPVQWINAACRADAPCTLGAYAPPWGNGDEQRPRLLQSSGGGISFANGGAAAPEQGYVVADLELACTTCGPDSAGVFIYNDVDDVRLERLLVRGFDVGVLHGGSQACAGAPGCDGRNERIALLDSTISGNLRQGFLGGGNDLVIAGNTFVGNGTGGILEHNVYIAGTFARVAVVGNTLERAAAAASGSCEGASLVAHGRIDDLRIEGNLFSEPPGTSGPACWGINLTPAYDTPERFLRAVVRGNTLRDLGTVGIALASCVDCLVENNVIVNQRPFASTAIAAPALAGGAGDAAMSALVVRNNSIFTTATNSTGIRVDQQGSGHVVVANAIQSTATSGFWACFALGLAPAAYLAVDRNVCGFIAGAGREWELGSGSLAQWRAASGLDAASLDAAPGYAATPFDLSAASPLAAMVGRGDPVRGAPDDIDGRPRGPQPDAGAYEWQDGDALFGNGFE